MAVITRAAWGAGPHRAGVIRLPVPRLVLHHTVTPFWTGADGARRVRDIARSRGFVDISYSWLTDRVGNEIEGRGWGRQGAHTLGYNSTSHALSLIGNLDTAGVPDGMIRGAVRVVRRHGGVGPRRITHGHRDLAPADRPTACPGRFAYARIASINAAASGSPTPPGGDVALSASDLAWIRGIVRQELDRNDTRLHHIAMALQVARGERENYLGRDIQEIRRNQVAAAQKAVDNVLKFYAASEDSALHKIIRDSNPD